MLRGIEGIYKCMMDKLSIYVVYAQYLKKIERWFVFLLSMYFEMCLGNVKRFMRIC